MKFDNIRLLSLGEILQDEGFIILDYSSIGEIVQDEGRGRLDS